MGRECISNQEYQKFPNGIEQMKELVSDFQTSFDTAFAARQAILERYPGFRDEYGVTPDPTNCDGVMP